MSPSPSAWAAAPALALAQVHPTTTLGDHNPASSEYPFRLNFYTLPPLQTITVDQFELAALNRLRILKALETAQIRNTSDNDMRNLLRQLEQQHMPLDANGPGSSVGNDVQRRAENTSHFILRLAYARTEDLRAWFVRQETLLFRLRLEREEASERLAFIATLNLNLQEVSLDERRKLASDLIAAHGLYTHDNAPNPETDAYFKVEWTRILDLVARRKCLVRGGYAYINHKDYLMLVVNEFKAHLTKQMEITARHLPRMDEDERLIPVLTNLSKQYLGKDSYSSSTSSTGRVTADQIDTLATRHFPLCMRHLHTQLKSNGHLKHGGRMQYGLFLKGIGLPIDEALTFWRRHFRHMTDDTFNKQYAYNIRHNYGLEGKRANYAPYSCVRIITSNPPGVGDHHGCPFKHWGQDNLKQAVAYYGVGQVETAQIAELARQGHCQVACTKFAEATAPPGVRVDPIEHPNGFYVQSVLASGGGVKSEPGDEPGVKGEPQR
ncbi:eukaryotic and archaeal DNA primase, large subunit-domain-containing protein [Catenaria anguillulae PL171]|uniref:DNA primase large subunit n=1 Tax=Catenaria anguillulae PL171 TaxID=765915 RepID=A0A1Y2HBE9_9FUNG|nr:eukaryotic and archaeal DNA primase, large subunit-domain-containing protein [Catenaria anguillulae PL171]